MSKRIKIMLAAYPYRVFVLATGLQPTRRPNLQSIIGWQLGSLGELYSYANSDIARGGLRPRVGM